MQQRVASPSNCCFAIVDIAVAVVERGGRCCNVLGFELVALGVSSADVNFIASQCPMNGSCDADPMP